MWVRFPGLGRTADENIKIKPPPSPCPRVLQRGWRRAGGLFPELIPPIGVRAVSAANLKRDGGRGLARRYPPGTAQAESEQSQTRARRRCPPAPWPSLLAGPRERLSSAQSSGLRRTPGSPRLTGGPAPRHSPPPSGRVSEPEAPRPSRARCAEGAARAALTERGRLGHGPCAVRPGRSRRCRCAAPPPCWCRPPTLRERRARPTAFPARALAPARRARLLGTRGRGGDAGGRAAELRVAGGFRPHSLGPRRPQLALCGHRAPQDRSGLNAPPASRGSAPPAGPGGHLCPTGLLLGVGSAATELGVPFSFTAPGALNGYSGPSHKPGLVLGRVFFLDPKSANILRRRRESRQLQEGGNGRSARARCWTGATGASGLE